jgi:transcriptional regulator of heat shock response
LSKKTKSEIEASVSEIEEKQQRLKVLGKHVAEKVQNAVIIAFDEDSLYYTGISNLFSQPEFRNYAYTVSVSTIFDQVEEQIESVFELLNNEKPKVLIGKNNPFGNMCGLVGGRLSEDSLFVILGPLRMDYALNYSFVDYLQKTL